MIVQETEVAKWGNSLGVRVPQTVAKQLGITAGSVVSISVEEGKIVIARGYTLAEMLASIPEDGLPAVADWGEPVGKEEFI
jgi:antitoxin MazE